ncbi:hypothetical protein Pcinc_026913 [Petrolisthes cinctipes]|uniref:Uncharacterized protein n=1 Tax=Petrolisthes cinctipes TaxID=88211 RepID=A0AAE1F508_PETCI|nr:hypothetical protein Pcinc_026913 [Petrolisthes cinctipes]
MIFAYPCPGTFKIAARHTCLSVSRVFSPSGWWGNPEVWVESEWMEGGWRQLDGRVLHWDLSGGPISASLVCVVRVPGPGSSQGWSPFLPDSLSTLARCSRDDLVLPPHHMYSSEQ